MAGCATGEEAYSLAILLHEAFRAAAASAQRPDLRHRRPPCARWSSPRAGCYDVEAWSTSRTTLRDALLRAPRRRLPGLDRAAPAHRLRPPQRLTDAPFTRLDLVTCRNFLIYLQPPAQRRVLALFHFGLKTGGMLVLGPSETPGPAGRGVRAPSTRAGRCSARAATSASRRRGHPLAGAPPGQRRGAIAGAARRPRIPGCCAGASSCSSATPRPACWSTSAAPRCTTSAAPASSCTSATARPSLNVLELLEGDLRFVVAGALKRAQKERTTVTYGGVETTVGRSTPGAGGGRRRWASTGGRNADVLRRHLRGASPAARDRSPARSRPTSTP